MRIRFVDADKWNDPWHWKLPPLAKLVKDFLHCSCDMAGFYKWDAEFVASKIKITPAEAEQALDQLITLKDGEYNKVFFRREVVYLHDHILVQDPNGLTIRNAAHIGAIKRLLSMFPSFPECMEHLPANFSKMLDDAKTREAEIGGSGKPTAAALRGLMKKLDEILQANKDLQAPMPQQAELFERELPTGIRYCLRLLQSVKNYPFEKEVDTKLLLDIMADFGPVQFVETIKQKITWWIDNPIKKKNNPRLQLRNWFVVRDRIGKERGEKKKHWEWVNDQEKQQEQRTRKSIEARKRQAAKEEAERDERVRKEAIEFRKWARKNCDKKDIEEWMKKMECEKGVAIYFMNKERKALGKRPLAGAVNI